jgi:hypothetical protein
MAVKVGVREFRERIASFLESETPVAEELPDAVGKMKQFASWFTHGVVNGSYLRKAVYEAKSATEVLNRVDEFFDQRMSQEEHEETICETAPSALASAF